MGNIVVCEVRKEEKMYEKRQADHGKQKGAEAGRRQYFECGQMYYDIEELVDTANAFHKSTQGCAWGSQEGKRQRFGYLTQQEHPASSVIQMCRIDKYIGETKTSYPEKVERVDVDPFEEECKTLVDRFQSYQNAVAGGVNCDDSRFWRDLRRFFKKHMNSLGGYHWVTFHSRKSTCQTAEKPKLNRMYTGVKGNPGVRKKRRYTKEEDIHRFMRWISTYIADVYNIKNEVQCYFLPSKQQILAATNIENKEMRNWNDTNLEGLYSLYNTIKKKKRCSQFERDKKMNRRKRRGKSLSWKKRRGERIRNDRHLTHLGRLRSVEGAEEIFSNIKLSYVNKIGSKPQHAEQRILDYLNYMPEGNNELLISGEVVLDVDGSLKLRPELLGGLRRSCFACAHACFANQDLGSKVYLGPLWPTKSAIAHMNVKDFRSMLEDIRRIPTYVSKLGENITTEHDSESSDEDYEDSGKENKGDSKGDSGMESVMESDVFSLIKEAINNENFPRELKEKIVSLLEKMHSMNDDDSGKASQENEHLYKRICKKLNFRKNFEGLINAVENVLRDRGSYPCEVKFEEKEGTDYDNLGFEQKKFYMLCAIFNVSKLVYNSLKANEGCIEKSDENLQKLIHIWGDAINSDVFGVPMDEFEEIIGYISKKLEASEDSNDELNIPQKKQMESGLMKMKNSIYEKIASCLLLYFKE